MSTPSFPRTRAWRRTRWRRAIANGAIALGEAGVALADRSGYVAWSIHRLIPIIIEAALWLQDFERVQRYGERLRRDSAQMGHTLGLGVGDRERRARRALSR